ncbi:MAG: hypothetical protein QM520_03750 [Gammaproteobacteria bacterium]|nr:hypothetical protein [Gammaproteobacteria bacterium]
MKCLFEVNRVTQLFDSEADGVMVFLVENLTYNLVPNMTKATKNITDKLGLRYKSRVSGSPFHETDHTGSTMSCYMCGLHKIRTQGSYRRIGKKLMFLCMDCTIVKSKSKTETL